MRSADSGLLPLTACMYALLSRRRRAAPPRPIRNCLRVADDASFPPRVAWSARRRGWSETDQHAATSDWSEAANDWQLTFWSSEHLHIRKGPWRRNAEVAVNDLYLYPRDSSYVIDAQTWHVDSNFQKKILWNIPLMRVCHVYTNDKFYFTLLFSLY